MNPLLIRNATVGVGDAARRCDVLCEGGLIAEIRPGLSAPAGADVVKAEGHAVLPGFVDCHTHACWAGSRLDEWERSLAGATYLEILESGGGIMSTVRDIRQASEQQLVDGLVGLLGTCLRHGTTTIEVKSGYGLTTADELKMLRAISRAGEAWPGTVVPTACIGHAKDPADPDAVGRTIRETLPAVTAEFPGICIDAYCESGAWSLDECLRLFDAALVAGHPVRIHADQFNDLGMIPEAIRRGFRSVDHLEATTPQHLHQLAESDTFGVMLPACGLHLDDRYADGRAFLDAGGKLAIATNLNPGSAPAPGLGFVAALAVRKLGLTVAESLDACGANAAALLGFTDRGELRVGARADLVMLDTCDARDVAYMMGWNPVSRVWVGGESV